MDNDIMCESAKLYAAYLGERLVAPAETALFAVSRPFWTRLSGMTENQLHDAFSRAQDSLPLPLTQAQKNVFTGIRSYLDMHGQYPLDDPRFCDGTLARHVIFTVGEVPITPAGQFLEARRAVLALRRELAQEPKITFRQFFAGHNQTGE